LAQVSSDAGAGHRKVTYSLTLSAYSAPCTMYGYPGVAWLTKDGAVVGKPATRVGAAPALIAVRPGEAVKFVVEGSAMSMSDECSALPPASQIQVFPPDEPTSLVIGPGEALCNPTVTAVTK
jgi:hypothetical protein